MIKIHGETYGCSASLSDYQIMVGLLENAGFRMVGNTKDSDLNLIATCVVKNPTEQRMIFRIKELTRLKKPLIVAGCMPKSEKRVIEKINPRASVIGPDSIQKIVDVVRETLKGRKVVFLKDLREPKLCLPMTDKIPIHITQISTGCNLGCSYCIVKLAKGRLFSYPAGRIIENVRQATNSGVEEIWITSQDNAAYNSNGFRLPQLLDEICKIEGDFLLRIGMMNPQHVKEILDGLIEVYKNREIFKFLHIPLQSASDRILRLMNRGYHVEDFVRIIKKFRKEIPQLTLSTDIIVGFPTESEGDFERTFRLVKKMKFDIVNISKYGARPGTPANSMKQLDSKIVNERSARLHKLVKKIQLGINKNWIGWDGKVLIDEKGTNNSYIGRNFAYKPIVLKEKIGLGKFFDVKIVDVTSNFLVGKTR